MWQKRDRFPYSYMSSPFMGYNSSPRSHSASQEMLASLAHGSRCKQTFGLQTAKWGCQSWEQSSINVCHPVSREQGTACTSRVVWVDYSENLHTHVNTHPRGEVSPILAIPFWSPLLTLTHPLDPHSWLPPSSCQLLLGLTTHWEPLWQHVWVSEMTLLSLLLNHCYWAGDRRPKPTKVTKSPSGGPLPVTQWGAPGSLDGGKCSISYLEQQE
jgi:hypothetical protein